MTAGTHALEIRANQLNDTWHLLALHGELDLASAPQLLDLVEQLLGQGRNHLVIDLEEVPHIDSTGYRILLLSQRSVERHQGQMVLVCSSRHVLGTMSRTGLDQVFQVFATQEAALQGSQAGS